MNKLVIFDLDGVLIDSRDLHFEALNCALGKVGEKYIITRDEHLKQYDGLPTARKLSMLTANKGLPAGLHQQVFQFLKTILSILFRFQCTH